VTEERVADPGREQARGAASTISGELIGSQVQVRPPSRVAKKEPRAIQSQPAPPAVISIPRG